MNKDAKIFVAGARGMVGSAIVRALGAEGYTRLLVPTSTELDLRNQAAVQLYFETEHPDYVFLAAAKVGGILANDTYRADFLIDNLNIQNNIIQAAHDFGINKLLFLASSCIYPKMAEQPIKEKYLLTGPLETTNEPYAIAKIAGVKLCENYHRQYGDNFISVMPSNLYGPNDNYDLQTSHVLPALLRKFHEAKIANAPAVTVWGSGTPRREFLHVDDLAQACLHLMQTYNGTVAVNVGTGTDATIKELAQLIKEIVGYEGLIEWDASKPDGTPRKLLDVGLIHRLGWKHNISLEEGIKKVYNETFLR